MMSDVNFKNYMEKFPLLVRNLTAAAWVAVEAWVQSLAQALHTPRVQS